MDRRFLAALSVAGVLVACGGAKAIHDHATSGMVPAGSCHMDGTGLYAAPDRSAACTPGQWITDPDLSTAHVCNQDGDGQKYNPRPPESVTAPLKAEGLKLYGLPNSAGATTESDHLYPVWLGGATTRSNLWPEPNYGTPKSAYEHNPKDSLEIGPHVGLYDRVCRAHAMTVQDARRVFEGDWRDGYRKFVGPTP